MNNKIKKVKPLEKPSKLPVIKISFIALLLLLGIITSSYALLKDKDGSVLSEEKKNDQSLKIRSEVNQMTKGTENLLKNTLQTTKNTLGNVLGDTTSVIVNTTSQSAQAVSDFIYDNTVGNIIKQVDKLPEKEQEKIKEQICK